MPIVSHADPDRPVMINSALRVPRGFAGIQPDHRRTLRIRAPKSAVPGDLPSARSTSLSVVSGVGGRGWADSCFSGPSPSEFSPAQRRSRRIARGQNPRPMRHLAEAASAGDPIRKDGWCWWATPGANLNPLCEINDPDEVAGILAQARDESISVARRFDSLFGWPARILPKLPARSRRAVRRFQRNRRADDPSLEATRKGTRRSAEKVRDVARQIGRA